MILFTRSCYFRPRSNSLRNLPKEVPPGERGTTSPARALAVVVYEGLRDRDCRIVVVALSLGLAAAFEAVLDVGKVGHDDF